ncbi:T9SS type A sorting domain-containing protein [candidate division WOR-3 bacterium]|nr:T9SS type A sorting domain-containing protein [candidate division WOR-3 bacterium]
MKLIVCLSGVFLVPLTGLAGWTQTYGQNQDDEGYCVCQTAEGGYVVAGYSSTSPGGWILKTDENGDTLWTSTPFAFTGGKAYSIQETSDCGYILTGYMAATDDGKYHLGLVKLDSLGGEIWWHSDMDWYFDFDSTGGVGCSVQETSDGGFIVTGFRQPELWGDTTGAWLIKTDSEGGFQWSKTYGAEYQACAFSVHETSDTGYIVSGYSEHHFWILKTDEDGDTVWTLTLDDWPGKGYAAQETSDDGYIVTGYVAPYRDGKYHFYLLKLASNGDTLWSRMDVDLVEWSGGVGRSVQPTSDDGYIITGYTSEWDDQRTDLFLVKTDVEGDTIWTRIYGGEDADAGYCVHQAADDGYIVAGATRSFGAGEYDLWLVKTDTEGDTVSVAEESPAVQDDWCVTQPVGRRIVLRYRDRAEGFHVQVFDASGRKVDEIRSSNESGIITWPITVTHQTISPGVYFICSIGEVRSDARKVILIK